MPLIRTATAADIPVIRQIAFVTWPVAYGASLSPEQLTYMLDMMYSEASLREQLDKGHAFFIASDEGKDAGFASVSDEGEHRFKLNKLYVDPSAQKTGAGRALLNRAIDHAVSHGGKTLFLQVKRDNPAQHFYAKHGFTIHSRLDLDIGQGFMMEDWIMEKALG